MHALSTSQQRGHSACFNAETWKVQARIAAGRACGKCLQHTTAVIDDVRVSFHRISTMLRCAGRVSLSACASESYEFLIRRAVNFRCRISDPFASYAIQESLKTPPRDLKEIGGSGQEDAPANLAPSSEFACVIFIHLAELTECLLGRYLSFVVRT